MKKYILTCCIAVAAIGAKAQNNSIKLNIGEQLFTSGIVALNYERRLFDYMSLNLRGNFGTKKAVPYSTFYDGTAGALLNTAGIYTDVFDTKFFTYGGQLQVRYFPSGEALNGFYIAPYFGYQGGKMREFSFLFPDINDPNIKHDGTIGANFNFFGGGLGVGNQWVLDNGLTFDVMWLGLGWGKNKFTIHGESRSPAVDFEDIDQDVNDFLNDTPGFNFFFRKFSTSYTDNSMDLTFRHGFPFMKILNFSMGYSF